MLRSLAKLGLARALRLTHADRWLGRSAIARGGPLVLGYHRVTAQPADGGPWLSGMAVSRSALEAQLDAIGRTRSFVSIEEVARQVASGEPFPRPVAAVTFDDGYADVYENAFPMLRRKGIPAAIFVVTDLVGTDRLLLHDRLYIALRKTLDRPDGPAVLPARLADLPVAGLRLPFDAYPALRILLERVPQATLLRLVESLERDAPDPAALRALRLCDWPMLREMSAAGITVGSHTRTHALLPLADPSRLEDELAGSRSALLENLGKEALHLAYPGGACTAATVTAALGAGYRFAYTICSHQDPNRPALTIPRRMLWERSGTDHLQRFSDVVFGSELAGVFDVLGGCRMSHGFAAARRSA